MDDALVTRTYLHDTAFDTVLDNELDGLHGTMLAKAMNTIHCLWKEISGYDEVRSDSSAYEIRPQGSTSCP